MPTILDYYQYAQLATAAYVNLGPDLAGNKIAETANEQSRLPTAIADALFTKSATNPSVWEIPVGQLARIFHRRGRRNRREAR